MGNAKPIHMAKGEKTTLTKANDKSYSLRTTVPTGIVKQLDLEEGDSILWQLVPDGNEFRIIIETEKRAIKKGRRA